MDSKAARRYERDAENALIDVEEKVDQNFKIARATFLLQDVETRSAIEAMVEQMKKMAGTPVFRFRDQVYPAKQERLNAIQEKNLVWIGIRLFTACALWDIRIGNFTLPHDRCARCGKESE